MFDIGWSELLVIAVVAIVVIGPKELPRLMRTIGHYTGRLRRAASDFQRQFEDAVRDTEIDEVRKAIREVHDTASSIKLDEPMETRLIASDPPEAAAGPVSLPTGPTPASSSLPKPARQAKRKAGAQPAKPRSRQASARKRRSREPKA